MSKEDDVPVTGPMLSLIKALHAARTLFISESAMAEELGLPKPENFSGRLETLFFKDYAPQAKAIGLHLNQQTFEALMRLQAPEEVWGTTFAELPTKFAFNPWLGQGYGGIKQI